MIEKRRGGMTAEEFLERDIGTLLAKNAQIREMANRKVKLLRNAD